MVINKMASSKVAGNVAVAMTTYNGEKYLEEQLRSIMMQTLQPQEVIICDDGSSDQTISIIRKLKEEYPAIRYMINEQQLGVANNFRKAVSLADSTDFIALSDQDDIWLPDKLEKLYSKLAMQDQSLPAIVYSDLELVDQDLQTLNGSFWNELGQDSYTHCFDTLLFGNFVTGCTVLMNKAMRAHFMKMPAHVEMHDAWIALIAFAIGEAGMVGEALVKYRSHASNVIFSRGAYRKKKKIERLLDHLIKSVSGNDFLKKEIRFAETFREEYGHLLSKGQLCAVDELLQLKHRGYLTKLMVFRRVLRTSGKQLKNQ